MEILVRIVCLIIIYCIGRAASGRGANQKSPRSNMPNEKTFSAAVDYGVSGTHRNKMISQKQLERI